MTHTPDEVLDNAPSDRLHACLAACAGIPTDKLTPGVVKRLIEAAEAVRNPNPLNRYRGHAVDAGTALDAILRELGSE